MQKLVVLGLFVAISACGNSSNPMDGPDLGGLLVGNPDLSVSGADLSGNVVDLGSAGLPPLTSVDFPGVTPCPTTAMLTDATALAALKTALKMGTITYHDLPFDGADTNIYRKKCGLEGHWNPADNVDRIPSLSATPELVSLLGSSGRSGICASYAAPGASNDGFAAAGVYRKQFQTAYMGTTYVLRTRVTVSGTAAGSTFAAQTVTYTGATNDVNSTLIYEVNGVAAAYATLWNTLVDAYAATTSAYPSVTLDVKKSAGPTIWSAKIELICGATM